MTIKTFSCLAHFGPDAQPARSVILARDEARARYLVRRELIKRAGAIRVELAEGGRALAEEVAERQESG